MDALQRAARAKTLLDDDLLQEAFHVLENEQIGIFTGGSCDAEQIMEAHRMVRALRLLKSRLESVVTDGKLAERRLVRKGQDRG
jgi:hypothetical protein